MYSPRKLVADHLNVDLLTHLEPEVANEVLIDPGLKLTHPKRQNESATARTRRYRIGQAYQRVVFPSLACWGTGAAEGSPGAGPWKGAVVGSAWPVMAVSAVAGAPGAAAAASAAGCWFWKESKFWKDMLT